MAALYTQLLHALDINDLTPSSAIIEKLWTWASTDLNRGHFGGIVIPTLFKIRIGQYGINIISSRFSQLIQNPVNIIQQHSWGLIFMQATGGEQRDQSVFVAGRGIAAVAQPKIKRPPNAFILYRQHHHPMVKAANPELHNNQISTILGKQWKGESRSVQNHFKALADAAKDKHLKDHPNYSYQPRKPSEKKKRVTKKKLSTLPKTTYSNGDVISQLTLDIENKKEVQPAAALDKTAYGNSGFELGDECLNTEELRAMLDNHNTSIPSNSSEMCASASKPMVYAELTVEAQDNFNFLQELMDFGTSLYSGLDYKAEPLEETSNFSSMLST